VSEFESRIADEDKTCHKNAEISFLFNNMN